jgi:hypothetical protein
MRIIVVISERTTDFVLSLAGTIIMMLPVHDFSRNERKGA